MRFIGNHCKGQWYHYFIVIILCNLNLLYYDTLKQKTFPHCYVGKLNKLYLFCSALLSLLLSSNYYERKKSNSLYVSLSLAEKADSDSFEEWIKILNLHKLAVTHVTTSLCSRWSLRCFFYLSLWIQKKEKRKETNPQFLGAGTKEYLTFLIKNVKT